MWTTALLATTLTMVGVAAPQTTPSTFSLQVSTPTQFADGIVRGASGTFGTLRIGQPVVLYVYSGKTMCDSSSPASAAPADAGFGWRLDVTPVREANGLVMQVTWQRLWDRGAKLSSGQRGHAEVTLKPGGKLMFDYLGAGETTTACDAIGMGLEVGLAPAASQGPLVETELWLVRKMQDGTEQTQRQVVRQRVGESPVPFYFDDVKVGEPASDFSFMASGALSVKEITDGKMRLSIMLSQNSPDNEKFPAIRRSGTAEIVVAAPGDVVSLPMPAVWVSRSSQEAATEAAKRLEFAKGQLNALLTAGKSELHPDVKVWRKTIADLQAASDQVRWMFRKDETFSVRLRSQIVK